MLSNCVHYTCSLLLCIVYVTTEYGFLSVTQNKHLHKLTMMISFTLLRDNQV